MYVARCHVNNSKLEQKKIQWKGLFGFAKLMCTPKVEDKVPIGLEMLFPSKWLDCKAEGDKRGRTNRQVQGEVCYFFFLIPQRSP